MRLASLTSLRFFAAALVIFHHGGMLLSPSPSPIASATSSGYVGVTFFFMLSGFVLAWSHRSTLSARYFYGRRFARIYPLHIVTAIMAALLALILGQGIDPFPAILNVFLLQSWVPVEGFGASLNGISWSLCCEAFFYLMFPVLIRIFKNRHAVRLTLLVGALIIIVAAISVFTMPQDIAQQFLYKGPLFRIGAFCLGILLATRIKQGYQPRITVCSAIIITILAYVLCLFINPMLGELGLPRLRVYGDLIFLPVSYLLIAAAVHADLNGSSRILQHPWLVRLGEASFALYMTHFLLLVAWVGFMGTSGNLLVEALEIAVFSVIAVGLSLAVHRWIERPAEAALRRRIGTDSPSAASGVSLLHAEGVLRT